jgi:hypothetical protein
LLLLGISGSAFQSPHLRIKGTRFVHADGRPFTWRGITAFRLLEMEAGGRAAEADAYLAWAAGQKLTVVRVLAMAKHLFELSPDRGIGALDPFLTRAARHGLFVEIVALADTASYDLDLPAHVRAVGAIAARHPNALIEIANEPYHSTQREALHRGDYLVLLRREIPAGVPVALGAAEYPELHIGGDYVTFHSSRSPAQNGFGHVRDIRIVAELLRKAGKPLVDDEPIGAGERFVAGRRDDNPERFRQHAAAATRLGAAVTFHYEGGLQARIPAGRELACFLAWKAGAKR